MNIEMKLDTVSAVSRLLRSWPDQLSESLMNRQRAFGQCSRSEDLSVALSKHGSTYVQCTNRLLPNQQSRVDLGIVIED